MSVFNPEDNTVVCLYGPPGAFDDPDAPVIEPAPAEETSFFGKIAALFRRIFDFIRNLFAGN